MPSAESDFRTLCKLLRTSQVIMSDPSMLGTFGEILLIQFWTNVNLMLINYV